MIFPGMDPYLEHPVLWSGVHTSLIVYIRNYLQPLLRPRYVAAIEERVFVETQQSERIPDVWIKRGKKKAKGNVAVLEADPPVVVRVEALEIHQRYVTILDLHTNQEVVTVIEVVSPSNKVNGPGRKSYLKKQRQILRSTAHLVEIDLLRTGRHVMAVPESAARRQGEFRYLACVNRAGEARDEFDLYPRKLAQRLPRIRIPLSGGDPDVVLDVQAVVAAAYADGDYYDRIDYNAPCLPALGDEDRAWAEKILKRAGFRLSGNKKRR
jgi:hypothetical protein